MTLLSETALPLLLGNLMYNTNSIFLYPTLVSVRHDCIFQLNRTKKKLTKQNNSYQCPSKSHPGICKNFKLKPLVGVGGALIIH